MSGRSISNLSLQHPPSSPSRFSIASPGAIANGDVILLKNLQLPFGVIAPDVWGKAKEQPALVSVSLLLHGTFSSAAGLDRLDESTIHYGVLAKRIRSACREGLTAGEISYNAEEVVREMARKESGRFVVARSTVEVDLSKASMFGEGISLINATSYDEDGKAVGATRILSLKKIKIMTLIGVNEYERSMKQPLIISVLLQLGPEALTSDPNATLSLFNLEQTLVQIVQETSFETLETLAECTVQQLETKMLDSFLPGTRVQLRIEKPRAIAFADAPAVELTRDVPYANKRSTRVANSMSVVPAACAQSSSPGPQSCSDFVDGITQTSNAGKLVIMKPYED